MDSDFFIFMLLCLFRIIFSVPSIPEQEIILDTLQDEWKDWKTNSGKYSGWRSQNIPPDGDKVFGLCMVHRTDNDNWLYSPIIPTGEAHSLIVETHFSMRTCKNYPDPSRLKTCEETIHLLFYETNNLKESTNQNNRLFKRMSVLFPQNKWSKSNYELPATNIHKVSVQIKSLGIRISYRDTGSCTMIRRIRIYYLACSATVDSFTSFPRTVSKHYYDLAIVIGYCVKGAEQKEKNNNQLQARYCQSNGLWLQMEKSNCHCSPGFTASNDKKSCIPCASGTYKTIPGPSRCSYCPKLSYSEVGLPHCKCLNGSFKKIAWKNNHLNMQCLKLPIAPRKLEVDKTDGSKVILSWHHPTKIEGKDHDTIDYYYVSCHQCSLKKVQFLPGINITGTNVTILGLTFGESYLFYVTSMASISNNSINMQSNPSRSSIRFILPNTNKMSLKSVGVTSQGNSSFIIYWEEPENLNPIELYMIQIIKITESNNSDFNEKYEYLFSHDIRLIYSSPIIPINIIARIRFKYDGVWSDLSPDGSNNIYQEKQTIFSWMPNADVIFLCFTSLVIIVIIVSISVVLGHRHIYMNMKRIRTEKFKTSGFTADNTRSSYTSITTSSPISKEIFFNEIRPECIIMKKLKRSGKYYDIYHGSIKLPRKPEKHIILNILKLNLPNEVVTNMMNECLDNSQFQHENILNIMGFCTLGSPKMILMEYTENGCLNSYLKTNMEKLTLFHLVKILLDISTGMHFLSERDFVHKKLSTHTIFVNESMVCKILICLINWNDDRDLKPETKFIDENKTCYATGWMAPEIELENHYSISSDVWAYGITMWEVFTFGEKPYWSWTSQTIFKNIFEGYRLPPPKKCPHNLHLLMLHCWMLDPSQRPDFFSITRSLEQLMDYIGKETFFLSKLNNICKSDEELAKTDTSKQNVHSSQILSNEKRSDSLNLININDFHSLKQNRNILHELSSYSTEQESIVPNSYVSITGIHTPVFSPNLKENNGIKYKINNHFLKTEFQSSQINLSQWLTEINLKKYKHLLKKNGYSCRSKLAYISISDLTEMGIKKASEIQIIINSAHKFRNEFSI